MIAQTRCQIETEVVQADIPLLLSKTLLKRAGAVLDIENEKGIMFKQPLNMRDESAPDGSDIQNEDDILIVTENTKKMLKLHQQLGHASLDRVHKLLTSSGNNDEECTTILKDIIKNYET